MTAKIVCSTVSAFALPKRRRASHSRLQWPVELLQLAYQSSRGRSVDEVLPAEGHKQPGIVAVALHEL